MKYLPFILERMIHMKFCDKCGTFMSTFREGYKCSKCDYKIIVDALEVKRDRVSSVEPVYIIDVPQDLSPEMFQKCPNCGKNIAFRLLLSSQGEHAGVKQERAVEKFTCKTCRYSWIQK
jgi:DNA-directed RNA polymerase subunit M/transcription elongation factor TFIIS